MKKKKKKKKKKEKKKKKKKEKKKKRKEKKKKKEKKRRRKRRNRVVVFHEKYLPHKPVNMNTSMGKECEVCNEEFNEEGRCPRSLPCSHCICSECIDKLIVRGAKLCPYCRQAFQASSSREIGANTFLLEVLRLVKEMELNATPPSPSPPANSRSKLVAELKGQTVEVSRQVMVNFREAKEKTSEVHLFNNSLRDNLLQSNEVIQNEILVKVHDILRKNTEIIKFLDDQNRRLDMQMAMIHEKERHMEEGIAGLHSAETLTQTATVIEGIDGFNLNSQNWLQSHGKLLNENVKTHQNIEKVISRTTERLRILRDVLEPVEEEAEENIIPDLHQLAFQQEVPLEITPATLRWKTEPVLELIRQRKVFAYQDFENRRRFAKISVDESRRIYLHYLTDQELPTDFHLIKHDDILKLLDAPSRLVFLEISSEEKKETLGKLYIRLFPNTKKAEQFFLLCSGEKGPTFVKSNILKVHCKGTNYEAVWCGDYENLGGKGGKALESDVCNDTGDALLRPQLAGTLWGRHAEGGETLAAQFWICTRDNPEYERYWCFGMVEEGLPILQEAIQHHSDIKTVVFSDAGIVLPI